MPTNLYQTLEKPVKISGQDPSAPAPEDPPVRILNLRQALLFAAGLYLCFSFFENVVRTLLVFFMAFLLAIILNAPVRWLEKRGVSRTISAAGVALFVIGGLTALIFLAGPPLLEQAANLAETSPQRITRLQERAADLTRQYPALQGLLKQEDLQPDNISKNVMRVLPRVGKFTLGLLGGMAAGLFLLVTALYTLATPRPLLKGVLSAVPPRHRRATVRALTRIAGQIEGYALATLLLMLIIGVISGVGLWLLGVQNPVLFGVIAGIGEGIPTIGPILSAIPPIVVSLSDDPQKALWVALLFLVVQQIENNVLVPIIMAQRLNLHPVSILFFVLTLGSLVGLLGAFLAVPAAIITKICFEEFYARKRAPHPAALDAAAEKILRAGTRAPSRRRASDIRQEPPLS